MGEALGPSSEEIGVKEETVEEKRERIRKYNEESIRTGRKTPFGETDLLPDTTPHEPSEETKEKLKKAQEKSGFGIDPTPEK